MECTIIWISAIFHTLILKEPEDLIKSEMDTNGSTWNFNSQIQTLLYFNIWLPLPNNLNTFFLFSNN